MTEIQGFECCGAPSKEECAEPPCPANAEQWEIDTDQLWMVKETIEGAHPRHTNYPLLDGDVLTKNRNCTFTKHTGMCVVGFILTREQESRLEPVDGTIVMM